MAIIMCRSLGLKIIGERERRYHVELHLPDLVRIIDVDIHIASEA